MNSARTTLLTTGLAAAALAGSASAQFVFTGPTSVPTGALPDHVAFADLDGDGDMDMAVTSDAPDKVDLFANNGAGNFTPAGFVFLPGGSSPAAIQAANLDGDADTDLVVTLKNVNSVQVLLNNGAFSFGLGSSTGTGLEPRYLVLRDLNGNGTPDVATSNRDGDTVSISLNTGGVLGGSANVAVGADPREITSGDFNGDGLVDLAVSAHDDRRIDILRNLGAGSFVLSSSLSVGAQLRPDGVVAADLDGDGDMDIASGTSGNGLNFASVFVNGGTGTFTGPFNYATGGVNPGSIAAGDLDVDGDMDLATDNQDSNSLSLLPGTGGAVFGAATLFATGTNPHDVTLADLDGNGGLDIGLANRDSNNVSIYINGNGGNGTTTYCVGAPNSAGPGAQISSTGSLSIAANTFTLQATGAVANQPGLFYYGGGQVQIPFGEGFRCVSQPFFRLNPPAPASPTGSASRLVNFTSGPAGSGPGQITPGSTWNFQYWYRDPSGGPNGFNLSNALSATFLP